MTAVVEMSGVRYSYGGPPVLQGVSLRVSGGETVALVGPNGAGKTTLTRLIVGLLHPDAGEIIVAGVPNTDQSPEEIARDAAYVFQHPEQQLFARTVIEDVSFGPRQLGRSEIDARDLAFHALLDLGIEAHAQSHPYDLPPAERKLVTLAAALAQKPRLLVLDEPTQGLDRVSWERVTRIVRDRAASGVAVLAVTHDLAFVAEAMERVVVLREGVIGLDTTAREVITNEAMARGLGLAIPPAAAVSLALQLDGLPIRRKDVTESLRLRVSGLRGPSGAGTG